MKLDVICGFKGGDIHILNLKKTLIVSCTIIYDDDGAYLMYINGILTAKYDFPGQSASCPWDVDITCASHSQFLIYPGPYVRCTTFYRYLSGHNFLN